MQRFQYPATLTREKKGGCLEEAIAEASTPRSNEILVPVPAPMAAKATAIQMATKKRKVRKKRVSEVVLASERLLTLDRTKAITHAVIMKRYGRLRPT